MRVSDEVHASLSTCRCRQKEPLRERVAVLVPISARSLSVLVPARDDGGVSPVHRHVGRAGGGLLHALQFPDVCVVGFVVVLLRAIGSCASAGTACTSVRHATRKDMRTSSACLLHSLNDVAGGTWAKLDVFCARCAPFFSVMRSIVHEYLDALLPPGTVLCT